MDTFSQFVPTIELFFFTFPSILFLLFPIFFQFLVLLLLLHLSFQSETICFFVPD